MRRRMIHRAKGHFLLAGIKLSELRAFAPGTVVFDPQVILQPGTSNGKDTHLFFHNNLPYRADNNFGGKDELWVYRDAYSSFHLTRPLLQFDLSGIPGNASISDATLELYVKTIHQNTNGYPHTIDAHKVTSFWIEGNNDDTAGDASWKQGDNGVNWLSYIPANGDVQTNGGGDFDATAEASFTIQNSSVLDTWLDWDLTSLAQNWLADPGNNNGVLLKYNNDFTGNIYRLFYFHSSESTSTTLRPKLTINYADQFTTVYYIRDASGQVIATYEK